MEQYRWKNTEELFRALNKECNYVIMRNFEDVKKIGTLENHEDIDFLCDDYEKMVRIMDARPRKFYDNKVQYLISLGGRDTKIDIRRVGDNYYDSLWQKEILEHRCWYQDGFFVMNDADYFYSLIYHAILQKKELAEDYQKRLVEMARALGITAETEKDFMDILIDEMKSRDYLFRYPEDTTIPNRFRLAPKEMCVGKVRWYLRRIRHFPIKVYSFIYNKKKVYERRILKK